MTSNLDPPLENATHLDDQANVKAATESENAHHADITFAKAAFAFRDGLDRAQKRRSYSPNTNFTPVFLRAQSHKNESKPDDKALADQAHHERHKRRIRIARTVQHLLSSALALTVAILQGNTYSTYVRTKNVVGAWPAKPNLLPTLMLFSTAIGALVIDIAALVAYLWPQTPIGHKAFSIAVDAHYIITTLKGVAYSYSAIVCKSSFDTGNSDGENNDLWSWSCSSKAVDMMNVNNCHTNCAGSLVAWIFAIISVCVEVLGVIVDQFVARDKRRWGDSDEGATETAESDEKPMLIAAARPGTSDQGRYSKISDSEYDTLDQIQDDAEDQLGEYKPGNKPGSD